MSVKASVSISEQQDAFARSLVEQGQYSSVSAVIQQGLELLREKKERDEAELAALRAFFEERVKGPFLDAEESRAAMEEMIERKRREYGV